MKRKQIDLFCPNDTNIRMTMAFSDMRLGRKVTVLNKETNRKKRVIIQSIHCDGKVTVKLTKSEEYHVSEIIFPKRYFDQVVSKTATND